MSDKVSELSNEIRKEIEDKNIIIKNLNLEKEDLIKKVNYNKDLIEERDIDINKFKTCIDNMFTENDKLEQNINILNQDIDIIKKEKDQIIINKTYEFKHYNDKINELNFNFNFFKNNSKNEINNLKKQLIEKEEENFRTKNKINELNEINKKNLELEIIKYNENFDFEKKSLSNDYEEKINSINLLLKNKDLKIIDLNNIISSKNNEIQTLNSKIISENNLKTIELNKFKEEIEIYTFKVSSLDIDNINLMKSNEDLNKLLYNERKTCVEKIKNIKLKFKEKLEIITNDYSDKLELFSKDNNTRLNTFFNEIDLYKKKIKELLVENDNLTKEIHKKSILNVECDCEEEINQLKKDKIILLEKLSITINKKYFDKCIQTTPININNNSIINLSEFNDISFKHNINNNLDDSIKSNLINSKLLEDMTNTITKAKKKNEKLTKEINNLKNEKNQIISKSNENEIDYNNHIQNLKRELTDLLSFKENYEKIWNSKVDQWKTYEENYAKLTKNNCSFEIQIKEINEILEEKLLKIKELESNRAQLIKIISKIKSNLKKYENTNINKNQNTNDLIDEYKFKEEQFKYEIWNLNENFDKIKKENERLRDNFNKKNFVNINTNKKKKENSKKKFVKNYNDKND